MTEWSNSQQNGLANGTNMTQANSDDNGAGDPYDSNPSVTGGAGGAFCRASTAQFLLGTHAIACANGTSGNANFQFGLTLGNLSATPFYCSFYWHLSALPLTTNTIRIAILQAANNSFQGEWRINSAGQLQTYDSAGNPIGSPSSYVHAANTWHYTSLACTVRSATVGRFVAYLRNVSNGGIFQTVTHAGTVNSIGSGGASSWRAGNARTTAGFTVHIGYTKASDTTIPNLPLLVPIFPSDERTHSIVDDDRSYPIAGPISRRLVIPSADSRNYPIPAQERINVISGI